MPEPDKFPKPTKARKPLTNEEKAEKARAALARYMSWVMPLKGRLAFRGQASAQWALTASAYRRLWEQSMTRLTAVSAGAFFTGYLHERVNEARMRFAALGDKKPLEVMAELQHYGTATGLIDFTESALVALWFACNDKPKEHGKVFAIRLDDSDKIREIRNKDDLGRDLDFYFPAETPWVMPSNRLWAWRTGDQNPRMIAQQSLFVFGRPVIGKEFFAADPYEVPAGDKFPLMGILETMGISENFVFSDFVGFAAANTVGKTYILRRAENYYTEKIEKEGDDPLLYLQRGHFRVGLGNFDGAVKDFDRAIELDPQSARAYSARGMIKADFGRDLRGGLEDCDHAIEIEPDNALWRLNRGLVKWYHQGGAGAKADFEDGRRLAEKAGNWSVANTAAKMLHQMNAPMKKSLHFAEGMTLF